jgi:hypothetical protein
MGQHVVKRANAGGDLMIASSIQTQLDLDIRFIGRA